MITNFLKLDIVSLHAFIMKIGSSFLIMKEYLKMNITLDLSFFFAFLIVLKNLCGLF